MNSVTLSSTPPLQLLTPLPRDTLLCNSACHPRKSLPLLLFPRTLCPLRNPSITEPRRKVLGENIQLLLLARATKAVPGIVSSEAAVRVTGLHEALHMAV